MTKIFKVELIGGPLCGDFIQWPENVPTLVIGRVFAKYELEDMDKNGVHKALYRGYAEAE